MAERISDLTFSNEVSANSLIIVSKYDTSSLTNYKSYSTDIDTLKLHFQDKLLSGTDNTLVRYGTSGVQETGIIVDDLNNISGINNLTSTSISASDVTCNNALINGQLITNAYLLSDIQSIDTSNILDGYSIYMAGRTSISDGGEDFFKWSSSDYSTEVTNDSLYGIYIPPTSDLTGASGAWIRQSNDIAPEMFGAVGDGSDSTEAFKSAVKIADGRMIKSRTIGHFVITDYIDNGFTGDTISISGKNPVNENHTHLVDTYSNTFAIDSTVLDRFVNSYTTIECSGSCFIGDADSPSASYVSTKLKHFSNFALYGTNGAKIGVHVLPVNTTIENSFFARFEYFGLLTRSGITSDFKSLGFDSNGFGLSETGSATANPPTYGSGCNLKVCSNTNAQAYHTINSPDRPTTISFKDIYCIASNYYINNSPTVYSGMRAIQMHGALSSVFDNVGGYQGCYLTISSVSMNGVHFENYANQGLTSTDNTPIALYAHDSTLTLNGHFIANMSIPSASSIVETASGLYDHSINELKNGLKLGKVTSAKILCDNPIRTTQPYVDTTSPALSATTTYVTIPDVIELDPTKYDNKGFAGIITVSISNYNNTANNSHALFFCALQFAGATRYSFGQSLSTHSTLSAGYAADISSCDFDDSGNLIIGIDWGASWNSTVFRVRAGLLGTDQTSSH